MKGFIALALILCMLLAFIGCSRNNPAEETQPIIPSTTEPPTTNPSTTEPPTEPLKPSEGLEFTLGDGDYYIVSGLGTCADTDIVIPDTYNGLPVTTIGDNAFNGSSYFISVTIPNSVTTIGNNAFSNSALISITIPDSVTTIGEDAFHRCMWLTGVWVDNNNPAYSSDQSGVLFNKSKTTLIRVPEVISGSYTIPDSVTTIGDNALFSCQSLTNITIPYSVTTIGEGAFASCQSLTSITIPDSVTTIGDNAFASCQSLTSITIPDGVTTIGEYAFIYCRNLTSVNISDSVTTIDSFVFYDCGGLTGVTIPDSVTTIGVSAFEGCSGLTSVTIPDSVTIIGESAFSKCYSLLSVNIGDSVTIIGDSAFYLCISLTEAYYSGARCEWEKIAVGEDNEYLLNAKVHFVKGEHDYDGGVETKAPTCAETGIKTYTCTSCGDCYTSETPVSENSFMALISAIIAFAIIAFAIIAFFMRLFGIH